MSESADYTVSILIVDLLGANGMRLVFFTIWGLGDRWLFFFFLYPSIPLSLLGTLGQSLTNFLKTSA